MTTYALVFVLLILVTFLYIRIAEKYNIIDKPNFRSSHKEPVIRGAGVLFFIAAILFFISSNFLYPYFIIGLTLVSLVSYIDDLITLSSKVRLIFQFVSIALVIYQVSILIIIPLWVLPLSFIAGIGFINAYNFMDGINGITGIYSLVGLTSLQIINFQEKIIHNDLILFVIISIIIFGFFNFRKKARFFCGDIGSISLAVILFLILLLFSLKLESPLILLVVSVYCVDAILTIFYRKLIGEDIMKPHRHHIYQKLTDIYQFSHITTSSIYGVLQIIICIIIFLNYKESIVNQCFIFVILTVILMTLYIFLFRSLKLKRDSN